jgi:GDPmannose 4,6-dehydratase
MIKKKALITGITGQDGAYLSQFLLEKDYQVIGLIFSPKFSDLTNLKYLGLSDKITFEECDLLNAEQVKAIIQKHEPDEVYNFAAQSSVGDSFKDPKTTISFNINSVLNLLEAIREVSDKTKFYQASSSETFGKVDTLPVTEKTPLHPLSPYAVSKASAHYMTVNYRESYGLFACCGILFNHESYLRPENYFIKKIIREALNIKEEKQDKLEVGNIDLKRDFGYAPEYVKAMWLMMQQAKPADFLVCSSKSYTLKDILNYVFDRLEINKNKIYISQSLYRPTDIEDMYGNNDKAKKILGWDYNLSFYEVLDILIEEEKKNRRVSNV